MENKKNSGYYYKSRFIFFSLAAYMEFCSDYGYEFSERFVKNFVHKNKIGAFGRCDFLF